MVNNIHNLKFSTSVKVELEFDLSDPKSIGYFIQKHRKIKNLTKAEVASKVGIHNNSLACYETAKQKMPTHVFFRICSQLGILEELGELLCLNGSST